MKLTSSQAVKLLRRLNEEYDTIIAEEKESRSFVATIQENLEDARPLYLFLRRSTQTSPGKSNNLHPICLPHLHT